ncbi:MAG TPA: uL15 family ribosomal protein [Candidatus Paceibacterota bacterium]
MQLHELQSKTERQMKKRVGRGGKRGKTSGRGTKGQKARSGHRLRPEVRDQIKKLPKLRGHGTNRSRTINDATHKALVVNLDTIDKYFVADEKVTPATLRKRGLISLRKGETTRVIKILGNGTLTKKLSFSGCALSARARTHIEAAGGTVV